MMWCPSPIQPFYFDIAVSVLQMTAHSPSHALCQMTTSVCLLIKKGTRVLAQVQLLYWADTADCRSLNLAFDLALTMLLPCNVGVV